MVRGTAAWPAESWFQASGARDSRWFLVLAATQEQRRIADRFGGRRSGSAADGLIHPIVFGYKQQ